MIVSAFKNFACPVDGLGLAEHKGSLRCEHGHSYDLAREGYCNLLLVQQKSTLDPGDNKEMVAARRRFLEGGHFAPIAEKCFEIVSDIASKASSDAPLTVIDAGCGEGYYLDRLKDLSERSPNPGSLLLAGFDISKWAVKAAAKRSKEISWAVAGNKKIPFVPGTVDVILSMFGFPDWKGFKGALKPGGHVVLVDPGPEHLIELRKIIYPRVSPGKNPALDLAFELGFELKSDESVRFNAELRGASQIQDLLAMTPHRYRISPQASKRLETLQALNMTVDVTFKTLQLADKRK